MSIYFIGCSSSKTATDLGEIAVPPWYNDPPKDPTYIYATAGMSMQDYPVTKVENIIEIN